MNRLTMITALLGFLCCKPEIRKEGHRLKTIQYIGGVIQFEIPLDWKQAIDRDGAAEYWDPSDESGTMRLSLLTVRGDDAKYRGRSAVDLLMEIGRSGAITLLQNGNACQEHVTQTIEDGVRIEIRFWNICNLVPPNHHRIAIFSYTTELRKTQDTMHQELMAILRKSIHEARFASKLGLNDR